MYPTLTPVGKPSIWYQKKKSRTELYNELSEKEKEIEQINAKELEVKTSLQEQTEQEDEDEEDEGEEEIEEPEEEDEEQEDEGAEDPSIPYHSILSDSVDMEESSLSYMYGSMQEEDDEDEDDDAY